ncbi:hypothetical protein [Vibrio coralliilyticus]|uniref:hypothetical protein n=1 Tax=Vibrio coralliilyticus TaxID=190893 RepID=UPI002FD1A435
MDWSTGTFKIIEKLTELFKLRGERRREVFKEYIDPLFVDLTAIHNNYKSTFDEILEQLRESPQPADVVRDIITNKKREFETLRVQISSFAKVYNEQVSEGLLPDEAAEFFKSVLVYFSATSGQARGYRGRFTDLLEYMDENYFKLEQTGKYKAISMVYKYRTESGELVGDDFGFKLYEVTVQVNECWNQVTQNYAKCKVELISG